MSLRRHESISGISDADDSDADYDVVSASGLSSSLASLPPPSAPPPVIEPEPSADALSRFATTTLSAEDVRAYVKRALLARSGLDESELARLDRPGRTVRVYVDGSFDVLHAGLVYIILFAAVIELMDLIESLCNSAKPSSPSPLYTLPLVSSRTLHHPLLPCMHLLWSNVLNSSGTCAGWTPSSLIHHPSLLRRGSPLTTSTSSLSKRAQVSTHPSPRTDSRPTSVYGTKAKSSRPGGPSTSHQRGRSHIRLSQVRRHRRFPDILPPARFRSRLHPFPRRRRR
jgi:hypothetical protein